MTNVLPSKPVVRKRLPSEIMKRKLMRFLKRSDENGFVATRPRSAKKGKYKTNAKTLLPYRPVPKCVRRSISIN